MSRVARRKALHGAGVACRSELQPPGGAGGGSTRRIAPNYVLPCPQSARKRARKTAHQRCQHLVLPLPRLSNPARLDVAGKGTLVHRRKKFALTRDNSVDVVWLGGNRTGMFGLLLAARQVTVLRTFAPLGQHVSPLP